MVEWRELTFNQLTNNELYQLIKLRIDVFVVEQSCPYHELDNQDQLATTRHLLGYSFGELVAYARLLSHEVATNDTVTNSAVTLDAAETDHSIVTIGRVVTKNEYRGNGLGHQLLEQAISIARQHRANCQIQLHAQHHLVAFYQQHQFKAISPPFLEDGIAHITMKFMG